MSQVTYGNADSFCRRFRYEVPLTGFSITLDNNPVLVINPAGTLATGTVVFPTNPDDGQVIKLISTQTQTALTLTAGTNDTIANAVTALTALTAVEYSYRLANRTWYRTG